MAKHEASPRETRKKKTGDKRRFKWLAIPLLALLYLAGAVSIAAGTVMVKNADADYTYDGSLKDKTNEDLSISEDLPLTGEQEKKVTNIALFGIDARNAKSFSGNSDSIMIVSIDEIHNKVKVTSVMRDTLVNIPDKGWGKLNSAYGRGGPELAVKTLNQMFNLNIRDYAAVNFVGMVDIIDELGGIEVDVTESERKDANVHITSMASEVGTKKDLIKKKGLQILSGVQAVCWARIRHVSTADGVSYDFGRTDRQRYVMEQLFDKAMSAGVSQYPGMIKALLPYVQTSLDYGQILSLAGDLVGGITFEQMRIPQMEYLIDGNYTARTGSSTVYYNLEYAGRLLWAFIYDDKSPADFMAENGIDKTRWAG